MEIIKAPAKQPKTAPAQVRDGEAIEGLVGRHAEFINDPIRPSGSITLSRRRHSFPETNKRNGYPPR
jgi:hypothetical protein